MLGIAAMLASCSQNEELFTDKGNNTVQQVTFTLATDEKPQTRATVDGLRYVVAVYDEAGTTEVKQETIFEKGFSTKSNNRGFGLALVKKVLERRNGLIKLDSNPVHGTNFTVTIPYKE